MIAPFAFWVVIGPYAVLILMLRRRTKPPPSGHCPTCGYNLTGNTSGTCPECGTPIPKEPADENPRPA